ncbi:MAG: hypothetical protein A2W26_01190 [Acidobacteria bacterium RBG_16_64_8]|nr:MAG: hypothetical protein A2W26_01190 [Acidobacteria bacterium RBG_16_64_8]
MRAEMERGIKQRSSGWSLPALLLGPFYYLGHGLWVKGLILLTLALVTLGLGAPIIWLYCGWRATSDIYERNLSKKGAPDLDRL